MGNGNRLKVSKTQSSLFPLAEAKSAEIFVCCQSLKVKCLLTEFRSYDGKECTDSGVCGIIAFVDWLKDTEAWDFPGEKGSA